MKTTEWTNLIFNNTNDLIFLVEIEANNIFRCVMVNPAYLSLTGFTLDQVVGKTPEEILPLDAAQFVLKKYHEAILAKHKIIYEEQVTLASGLIILETSLQPIFNEKEEATHLLGVLRDVTSTRKNENALQESEQAFKNIFNLSPIPMLITSVEEGTILMANECFASALGFSVSDLIGKRSTILYSDPSLREVISDRIHKNGNSNNLEVTLKNSDGQLRDFLFSCEVISIHGEKMFLSCFLDISERKSIEMALTKSENNLRTVFDNTEIGYILLDRALDVRAFNQPANIFSIKDHGKPLEIGINFYDFFPTERHEKLKSTLDLAFSGEIVDKEIESNPSSSETYWYHVRYSPVWNKENLVLDILMSIEDITDRKKAQHSIRESEEKYQLLVEHAEDAIFLLDDNTRFTHVNSGLCKLVGYSKEELMQMQLADIYPSHELEKRPLSVEYLKVNNKLRIERKWKRKDGSEIDVEINTRVMEGQGYLNIARDITERKKAEEKLQLSEQRLSYAMTATSDALWEWDYLTGKTFYSPRWYGMLGYEDQEFEMTFDSWKNLCHPDDLELALHKINDVLNDPKSSGYNVEFRMRHKDGSWIWIMGRGNVVKRDENFNPILLSGTNSDITERNRTEEELQKT
ncbi:MAG: PAS domain S-box protein, partial [Cytophagales bacterium]|nr:PAS domain S-box protein [Cytophagales bacterium]